MQNTATYIADTNLWRVGFDVNALSLIKWMSGLVDIQSVYYDYENAGVVFIVRENDTTGTLFKDGLLAATAIPMYQELTQPLSVPLNEVSHLFQ